MTTNYQRLSSIIEHELDVDPRVLAPDTRLADIADSLDWINLLTALEEEFRLHINTEQSLQLQTWSDLVRLVAEPRFVTA